MKVGDKVIVERKYDNVDDLKETISTNYWVEIEGEVIAVADGYVKIKGTSKFLGVPFTVKEWFRLGAKDYRVIPFSD